MPGIGVIIIFTVSVDISIIYCFKAEIFKPHPLFIQRHICTTRRDMRQQALTKPVTICGIQKKYIFPYLENNKTLVHYGSIRGNQCPKLIMPALGKSNSERKKWTKYLQSLHFRHNLI